MVYRKTVGFPVSSGSQQGEAIEAVSSELLLDMFLLPSELLEVTVYKALSVLVAKQGEAYQEPVSSKSSHELPEVTNCNFQLYFDTSSF